MDQSHQRLVAGPSTLVYTAPQSTISPLLAKRQQPQSGVSWSASASDSAASGTWTATVFGDAATPTQPPAPGEGTGAVLTSASGSASSSFHSNETSPSASHASDSSSSSSSASPTSSYSRPWTYTATPSRSTSGSAPSQSVFVPGVVVNCTLAPENDVYSIPINLGHNTAFRRKRASDWDGSTPQVLNMQIDLGSSDMWVATDLCQTSDCRGAPRLFNTSASYQGEMQPISISLQYVGGHVSGEVYWEQITIGQFGIPYQAMVAAQVVEQEGLKEGNFSGLLGLAFPANSHIVKEIPGTTSSNPDGATFLDNLFASGDTAPTLKLFSLSLERRDDVRTRSTIGFGAIVPELCPAPCEPPYTPVVARSTLGKMGYLHWRLALDGLTATTFSDEQGGKGASHKSIPLGSSQAEPNQPKPLVVLDSGGAGILVGSRDTANAIYGAYGIGPGADGQYRLPCAKQLAFSLAIGGHNYSIHPLDMSWPDPGDSTGQICVGAIQYNPQVTQYGDIILGSSFLKNVYSIFQYPQQTQQWQPYVGLISLTDASSASKEFYAVRTLKESLNTISQGGGDGHSTSNNGQPQESHRVVSTAIIAACSVVGFFVLAAGAFCAWWFWFRRKHGASGHVEYKMASMEPNPDDPPVTLRSQRKHENTKRQKSLIEGYSDYGDEEDPSWRSIYAESSRRDSARSIPLGNVPEDREGIEPQYPAPSEIRSHSTSSGHTRVPSVRQGLLEAMSPPLTSMQDQLGANPALPSPGMAVGNRRTSGSLVSFSPPPSTGLETPPRPALLPLPHSSSTPITRVTSNPPVSPSHRISRTLSMSGPFPSATNRNSQLLRGDGEDYFSGPSLSPEKEYRRLSHK